MTETYTLLFETGDTPDARWAIEEGPDGRLYVSSNAETRRLVGPGQYSDAGFAADLRSAGVPESLVGRFLRQAGFV